jgi:putative ABC transport system permease protein
MLGRRPVVSAGAILSLALGIGANTAIFSVLHRVVLNPLPYRAPEELMVVFETNAEYEERWVAPANFIDWRRSTKSFAALAAFDEFRPTMTRPPLESATVAPEPEVVRAFGVSGNYFTTLGVRTIAGRTLLPSDDEAGAADVAVLSEGFRERAFGSTRDVIGRTLALDNRHYTIVGIMPRAFETPMQSAPIDLWVNGDRGVPRTFPFGGDVTAVRDSHIIYVLGRLAPGVSREIAQQELTTLMGDLARRYPDTNAGLGVNVKPLHAHLVGNISRLVTLLQLAVGMLLLIACANVAHLLLGQAVARHTEMSTRMALGAGRGRLVRQLLMETLVIAIPGGVLGLLLAVWGLDLLVAAAPQGLPRLNELAIDRTVLAFTTAVTLATATLFGLGPAWQFARDCSLAQSQSTTRVSGARAVRRWHHAIVIIELAGAHVLLIGAGLLMTSLVAAQRVPLGFASDGRVVAELNLAPERYLVRTSSTSNTIDTTPKLQFVDRVLDRVRETPGVRGASAAFTAPLTGAPNRGIVVDGRPPAAPGQADTADFQVITPDFFRTVGATLIRGRALTAQDSAQAPAVVVVNQTFVDKYFGSQNPLGRRVQFGSLSHEIVGVVSDMRYRSVETPADPTFYIPMAQNAERWPFLSFLVWTDEDPAAALSALGAAIREADPQQAVTRLRTIDAILNTALAARRFNTTLVVVFASIALLLAAIGTYGVMSFAVTVRTRELGVRAALGATPRDLTRLMLRGGAAVTALAVAIGLGAGMLFTGLLRTMVFGITPRDPATFVMVGVTLAVVALMATWLPTRRVIAGDPVRSLRNE